MKRLFTLALTLLFALGATPPPLDVGVRAQTLTAAEKALNSYFFVTKVRRIRTAIEAHRAQLIAVDDPLKFSDEVTKVLYDASHDKHLGLGYSRDVLPPQNMDHKKPSAAELAEAKAFFQYIDYGYESSARLPGNIGYMRIGGFPNAPWPKATFDRTMWLVNSTDALIIDMRGNGGGDPKAVNYLLAYFFAKPREVTGFLWRHDKKITPERMFTPATVGGPRYLNKPVYVLTDNRTISGGEQFCYDLQALHRATLIGATTAGGANIGGSVRLNDHFSIFIPVGTAHNPYTGRNWEGVGVKPDIPIDPKNALLDAYTRALKSATNSFEDSADARARALKDPAKMLHAVLPE